MTSTIYLKTESNTLVLDSVQFAFELLKFGYQAEQA